MRYKLWNASLWPGCWHAWRGEWRGLALAVGFAVALNAALLGTFGSLQGTGLGLPQRNLAAVMWLLPAGLWTWGLIWLRRDWPTERRGSEEDRNAADAQFQQAQHEYLRGHWIEVETLLARLLRDNPLDAEARLMLAAVTRRTKRWTEARRMLKSLQDDPSAGRWLLEIQVELLRIEELENEANLPALTEQKVGEESAGNGELSRAA